MMNGMHIVFNRIGTLLRESSSMHFQLPGKDTNVFQVICVLVFLKGGVKPDLHTDVGTMGTLGCGRWIMPGDEKPNQKPKL